MSFSYVRYKLTNMCMFLMEVSSHPMEGPLKRLDQHGRKASPERNHMDVPCDPLTADVRLKKSPKNVTSHSEGPQRK